MAHSLLILVSFQCFLTILSLFYSSFGGIFILSSPCFSYQFWKAGITCKFFSKSSLVFSKCFSHPEQCEQLPRTMLTAKTKVGFSLAECKICHSFAHWRRYCVWLRRNSWCLGHCFPRSIRLGSLALCVCCLCVLL